MQFVFLPVTLIIMAVRLFVGHTEVGLSFARYYIKLDCSGTHALLSLALYVQFRKCRVYIVLCRAVLLCS